MKVAKQTEKMFVLENQLDLLGKLNKLNRLRLFAKYLRQLVAGWDPANFAEKYSIEWEKSKSGWHLFVWNLRRVIWLEFDCLVRI